jgi:hypothetical protein
MVEQKTAAGWGPAAASEDVGLGKLDNPKFTPDTPRVQVAWLRRRFNLAPQRAALVAELAMPGGAA